MKYFFSDKDLFSFDNNTIEYFNNGKYILSKILINIDPHFAYYKDEYSEKLRFELRKTYISNVFNKK